MRRQTWSVWLGSSVLAVATLASCSREMRQGASARERRAVAPPAAPAPTPVWEDHRALWNLVQQWGRLHGPARGAELRELYATGFRGLDVRERGFSGLFDLARWHSTFLTEGDALWVSSIELETWQDPGSTLPRDHARIKVWAGIDSDGWESSRSEGLHRLALQKQAGVWRITAEQLERPTATREPVRPVTARELTVGLLRGGDGRNDRLTQVTLGSSQGTQVIDLELDVSSCKPGPTSSADELFVLVCSDEPLHRVWLRRDPGGLVLERGGIFCDKCNPRRLSPPSLWTRRKELTVALPPGTRVNAGMLQ